MELALIEHWVKRGHCILQHTSNKGTVTESQVDIPSFFSLISDQKEAIAADFLWATKVSTVHSSLSSLENEFLKLLILKLVLLWRWLWLKYTYLRLCSQFCSDFCLGVDHGLGLRLRLKLRFCPLLCLLFCLRLCRCICLQLLCVKRWQSPFRLKKIYMFSRLG